MIDLIISLFFLAILIFTSSHFIDQSLALAKRLKIGSFVVGFVILALGTSLPELITSTYSTYAGHPDLAISSVIGSNIVNISLILGLVPLIASLKLRKEDVHFNIPLTFLSTIIFVFFIYLNGARLTSNLGVLFLFLFILLLVLFNRENGQEKNEKTVKFNFLIFLFLTILLIISGRYFVEYLTHFSQDSGINESLLGFFLTAIGTSVPELVTTIVALKKGKEQLGMGNLLGSNIFNTFFILSVSAQIATLDFKKYLFDLVFMSFTVLLVLLSAYWGKRYYFSKKEGIVMILSYIMFLIIQLSIF